MYRCEICGLIFARPLVTERTEPRPDGFRERFREVLCPVSMAPHINKVEDEEDGKDSDDPNSGYEPRGVAGGAPQ